MKKLLILPVLIIAVVVVAVATHHSADKTVPIHGTYVALGDSVAAGIGLKNPSDSSACDRTDQAYSHVVASSLQLTLTSFACSEATIPVGITGSQEVNKLAETPQLTALYKQPKPKLVTITIGANDVGWSDYLKKCYVSSCGDEDDQNAVTTRYNVLTNNLQALLANIKSHYNGHPPTVIFTSYYQVFPSSDERCLSLTGITHDEISWVREQQAKIGQTVQAEVQKSGYAKFAPVSFDRHELCTSDPWVQSIADKKAYHPTADGQKAMAQSVLKTYRSVAQ